MKISFNRLETRRKSFVIIATCRKFFNQKLESRTFKVSNNLHRGCFRKFKNVLNGGKS